jgi:hypothetical protein
MKISFAGTTLSFLPALFVALVPAVLAPTQGIPTQPQGLHNPQVNYHVHFDLSPPLRELAARISPAPELNLALPPTQSKTKSRCSGTRSCGF